MLVSICLDCLRFTSPCFKGFNKEIEEISRLQRGYSVPDLELREGLKRDNKEFILPKYYLFYDRWVDIVAQAFLSPIFIRFPAFNDAPYFHAREMNSLADMPAYLLPKIYRNT